MLKKIGASVEVTPIDPSYVVKVGEKRLEASLDIEKYTANLIRLFPDEKENILRFVSDMKRVNESLKYVSRGKPRLFTLLARHRLFMRYARKTTRLFVDNYAKNPELIASLTAVGNYTTLPVENQSFLAFANIWSAHHLGEGMSLIKGGTRVLVDALVGYIDTHGGQVVISRDVKEILVERNKAVGVRTVQGDEVRAKAVVSTASNEETYLRLVDGRYLKRSFVEAVRRQVHSGALFQLFLGIKELDGKGLENVTTFSLGKGLSDHFEKVKNWDLDAICEGAVITVEGPENSPPGTRSINISTLCPYDHPKDWFIRSGDKKEYANFKERIAEKLIEQTTRLIPNLRERVIVQSTATPLTMYRYTRATRGGLQGLAHTVAQSGRERGGNKTPIGNLYRAGQYVFPGAGIVTVAISGTLCAELIMKEHAGHRQS